MATEPKDNLGRSARLQLSRANNPKLAVIMLSRHVSLIARCPGLGLLIALAACQPTGSMPSSPMNNSSNASNANTNTASIAGKNDKSAQTELYRLNPAPKEGYEIELEIKSAPGPFEKVGWGAMYQATGCSYVVSESAGVRGTPERQLTIPFIERTDGTYVATAYLDAMLEEDYFGNGVCRWQLTSVGPWLKATAGPDETSFGVNLTSDQLRSEQPIQIFYPRSLYPRTAAGAMLDFGRLARTEYPKSIQNDLFSVVIRAHKVSP